MTDKGKVLQFEQQGKPKNNKVNSLTQYADVKVGWLRILRYRINDYNVITRDIHHLKGELTNYYLGTPIKGINYKAKIDELRVLEGLGVSKLKYIKAIDDELRKIDTIESRVIVTYLTHPDLTIPEVAEELGVSQQSVRRLLRKYNTELDETMGGYVTVETIREFLAEELLKLIR